MASKSRGIPLTELLTHDLTTQSPLFDGDFIPKPDKYTFVKELEKNLEGINDNFEKESQWILLL